MLRTQQEFLMRGRVKAFTLVEILVVIGIIALLIGILVPTISKARESSRTAGCLANLRQLTAAAYSYAVDHNNYIIPVGNSKVGGSSYWWCNILVDGKYMPAPSDPNPGAQPQMRGPFFCLSGNQDSVPTDTTDSTTSLTVPPNRTDERGAAALRRLSTVTNISVDVWYGINGEDAADPSDPNPANSTTKGTPCRRIQKAGTLTNPLGIRMTTMDMVKKPSELVLFFDGILYNHTINNGNRINARHGNKTQTNIGFFDGHAETFLTKDLPQHDPPPPGMGTISDADTKQVFSLSNLQQKYPRPLWLLEQQ
jgi:prepilin-type processing-associated H-X9-DG protein